MNKNDDIRCKYSPSYSSSIIVVWSFMYLFIKSPQNYRPISNLPFLGKVIERCAMNQFTTYLSENNLFSSSQSAYRQYHSTETALIRVANDLLLALDNRSEAILVLLDLTAAFDTIDHKILLDRLKVGYGVGGSALTWFSSYLKGRKQAIKINDARSEPMDMEWGVPQGSIVGPILFITYTAPVEDIIRAHGLSCVMYADDTQLYITMKFLDRASTVKKIEDCIHDIKAWMVINFLMLNDSKTEVLHITSKFSNVPQITHLTVGCSQVQLAQSARNLGAIFDTNFQMTSHINNICRGASCALRKISKIRNYLDKSTTEKLVHAFVTSRLDNNNGLLIGLPQKDISKLQRIQNSAARLISLTGKNEHITSVIRDLHWLPVNQRITYKILILTFKILHHMSPDYLMELITPYTPTRSLRSCSQNLLKKFSFL